MAAQGTRWRSGWRRGAALVGHLADDPQAELLAMIWGPRFDREQALQLLLRWPRASTTALQVLQQAADHFDRLTPARQERLRRWALQAAAATSGSWTMVHAPHPADRR